MRLFIFLFLCIFFLQEGHVRADNNNGLKLIFSTECPKNAVSEIQKQIKSVGKEPQKPIYVSIQNTSSKTIIVCWNPEYPSIWFNQADNEVKVKSPPYAMSMPLYPQEIKPNESYTTYVDLFPFLDLTSNKKYKIAYNTALFCSYPNKNGDNKQIKNFVIKLTGVFDF